MDFGGGSDASGPFGLTGWDELKACELDVLGSGRPKDASDEGDRRCIEREGRDGDGLKAGVEVGMDAGEGEVGTEAPLGSGSGRAGESFGEATLDLGEVGLDVGHRGDDAERADVWEPCDRVAADRPGAEAGGGSGD